MTTTTIQDELQAAQIRLAAALRAQQDLEAKEAELAQTRLTLAAAKEDTDALQAQLKRAMELSVRNKLEQLDNEARIAQAAAEAKAAADAAAHVEKIAKAKELNEKLEAITQAARDADEALALYTNKLAIIKGLKSEVVSGLRHTFIAESWMAVPNTSMETETREGRNITDVLSRTSDIRTVSGYNVTSNAVRSFTSLSSSYLTGFVK